MNRYPIIIDSILGLATISPLSDKYSDDCEIPRVALTGRIPAILADCLVLGITWRESYKTLGLLRTTDHSDSPSLHRVLLQNAPDALGQADYIIQFLDPASTILTSRFLLDLRATNEKMSKYSSVSAGSLEFAGADILSGHPQPFLSFADDEDANEVDEGSGEVCEGVESKSNQGEGLEGEILEVDVGEA
ncbi:hypothetical protein OH77DRAFT_1524362 [Trametes cingulata]|nr:hypothetical protein OH77DRAFT_1524362 [Trametes cingulata]